MARDYSRVSASFVGTAHALRLRSEPESIRLADDVQTMTERRRQESAQMNLRHEVIQRHVPDPHPLTATRHGARLYGIGVWRSRLPDPATCAHRADSTANAAPAVRSVTSV